MKTYDLIFTRCRNPLDYLNIAKMYLMDYDATLASTGNSFNRSRERTRQICAKFIIEAAREFPSLYNAPGWSKHPHINLYLHRRPGFIKKYLKENTRLYRLIKEYLDYLISEYTSLEDVIKYQESSKDMIKNMMVHLNTQHKTFKD